MNTFTLSSTYTVTDVAKVFDRFAADLAMIAQATGLISRDRVADIAHDVKLMAQRGYVDRVDIVLRDGVGREICAAKYTVSTDAAGWIGDRPGNNLWRAPIDGQVDVVVSYTSAWWALSEYQRISFFEGECVCSWGPSDIDTTYPGMVGRFDRRYASNAYGLERTLYEGIG
jgi:Bacterial HORMA domain family 1